MVTRFIAALICLCAVNAYLVPDFLKGNFGRAGECGRRQPVTTDEFDKIVGGQAADHGEYPWQVSLQYESWGGFSHFCGGSILDETTIITAAHCTEGVSARSLQVVAGDHRLNRDDGTEQAVGVSKIISHRSFNSQVFTDDIALLKLSGALDLSGKYARPVCLPSVQKEEPSGYATVTGWGSLREGGSGSNILQEVSVPLMTDARCRQSYGTNTIVDHMLCAGYEEGGKDACQGDSGGPLVVEGNDGSSTLVGIVSWGTGCALPDQPGVYTQVSYFLDWISQNRA